MKLSEIKGPRALDVIADLIEPIAELASDEAVKELFNREELKEGEDARDVATKKLVKGLPVLLKDHKKALITIFATLSDVPYKTYEKNMTLMSIMRDAIELLNDEAFTQLFT